MIQPLHETDPALANVQRGKMTDWEIVAARRIDHDPRYIAIPPNLIRGLYLWARFGDRPGSFLQAVLCNNLTAAAVHADPYSAVSLKPLGLYVERELPRDCWGSPSTLDAWEAWHAALHHRQAVTGEEPPAP